MAIVTILCLLLEQAMVPLGIWPCPNKDEFDLPSEWKAAALKRYETPVPYRKLKVGLGHSMSVPNII